MKSYVCVWKDRDCRGKIETYRIQDSNGVLTDVKADDLKRMIMSNQIEVVNLKLTSDYRLIDRRNNLDNRNRKYYDKISEKIKKIANYLGCTFDEEYLTIDGEVDGPLSGNINAHYYPPELFTSEVFGNVAVSINVSTINLDEYNIVIGDLDVKHGGGYEHFGVSHHIPQQLLSIRLPVVKKELDFLRSTPQQLYANRDNFKKSLKWLYKHHLNDNESAETFFGMYIGNLNRAMKQYKPEYNK